MRVGRVVAALSVAGILATPAFGADGDLDPTFGKGGKVVTGFGAPAASANSLALQADGKIIAAGWVFDPSANVDFALARYLPDGSPDPTFGSGGRVQSDYAGQFDIANAVAIQPDGKIIAAGFATIGLDQVFAIARYLPDGSLDPTFDSDGRVTGDFFGIVRALVLLPDGKVLVAGSGYSGATADFAMARYNPNGSLDTGFGKGGTVFTDFAGLSDGLYALVALPDGQLFAVGTTETNVTGNDLALARYNADGTLDFTFGIAGKMTRDFFGRGDVPTSAALQPDGKIVIAMSILDQKDSEGMSAIRILPDGSPDPTFGIAGRAGAAVPGAFEIAHAIGLQSDGKIVMAGVALGPTLYDFVLVRFETNGDLDPLFGSAGTVTTDFLGFNDDASALAIQPDGRIIASGTAFDATTGSMALARYLGSPAEQAPSCPHSAGFWKTHRSEWPVASLTLGAESYSGNELAALLTKPVRGDASVLLARELIAAKFNIAAGAGSKDLAAEIDRADRLLTGLAGRLPYGISPSSPLGHSMVVSAGRLAARNNPGSSPECGGSR
jgi:uncharacterized delta-60 repeat protein